MKSNEPPETIERSNTSAALPVVVVGGGPVGLAAAAHLALAPLIDPNLHSCGTVPPHGAFELAHAGEPGIFVVGMKAYGRAPTFLMLTGYGQVRSVVALLDGEERAAREVELVLPESGVCSADRSGGGCCAPAPTSAAASCYAAAPSAPSSSCRGWAP